MKIRNGFVSNSSSSSFVLKCKKFDVNSITIDMLSDDKFSYYILGDDLVDGDDLIPITDKDMLNECKRLFGSVAKKYPCIQSITENEYYFDYEHSVSNDLPVDEFEEFLYNLDQHSTNDVFLLLERYEEKLGNLKDR